MYGATSGDWKRSSDGWTEAPATPETATPRRQRPPRQSSTLPHYCSAEVGSLVPTSIRQYPRSPGDAPPQLYPRFLS